MGKHVLFIAALQEANPNEPTHLAAHKKIFILLNILTDIGCKVTLFNSGPPMGEHRTRKLNKIRLNNNHVISCFHPTSYKYTNIGRLTNIFTSIRDFEWVAEITGMPDIIWVYNGYALEMRVCRYAHKSYGIKTVFEYEDWQFARGRIFNPKSLLDWVFWRAALPSFICVFVVNNFLAGKIRSLGVPILYLPTIVENKILRLSETAKPFWTRNLDIKCGYFGGLETEKGVGFLIEVIKKSIERSYNISWLITGHGSLASKLVDLSKKYPDRLVYLGKVDDHKLLHSMGAVDVLLNPHLPNNGVFPFKLAEAVSSGRLVISSPLTVSEEVSWIGEAIVQIELDCDLWLNTILQARSIFLKKEKQIKTSKEQAELKVSTLAVSTIIKKVLRLID